MASSLSEQVKEALQEGTGDALPFPTERRGQELFAMSEQLKVAGLKNLAEVDRQSVPLVLGYTSTQRYVAHTQQVSPHEANERVAVARLIAKHDLTAKVLTEGHISLAHAALLAKAAVKFEDQYRRDEAELVTAAVDQELDMFTNTIARWCHAADLEAAAEDASHRHQGRGVWVQQRLDGSGTGRFDLDPVATATLVQALDSMAGKPDPHDAPVQRTLAQRRADALEEMALPYGPQEDGTEHLSDPHGRGGGAVIEAVINLNFDGDAPPLHQMLSDLHRTGPVSRSIIEQISCDAHWRRVLCGASQILDYSSPVADITPNMRRALRLRDRHCQFPGCNRPWNWCDIHHIISRHDGGPTTLDNLALLCRFHHSLQHQQGWEFGRDPVTGETWFSSP
jgi:hypothetical protein